MRAALGLALAALLAGLPAAAQERVALVIGNAGYESVGALRNPGNDATDVSVALEGLGFEVHLGIDLTRDEMLAATARFAEAAEGAEAALVFYAGHGFQVGGRNYLVPVDASIAGADDVAAETIPLRRLIATLDDLDGVKMVFLDACRDNPLGAAAAVEEGLARVGTGADFLFSYATQPDNVAYDGTGRNSYFTEALLSHLYTPGQDVGEMMRRVRADVLRATGGRQIPWENSSLTRAFAFDESPLGATEDTLLWQVAARERDPLLAELYVERFPEGAHGEEARALLAGATRGARPALAPDAAEEAARRLWEVARRTRMRPLAELYLERYPGGPDAEAARYLLGTVPAPEEMRAGALCERLTTHPSDATTMRPAVPVARLRANAVAAVQACSQAVARAPEVPHYRAALARATYAAGDVERAVAFYRDAAERGDLRAMVSLAQLHRQGTGVAQDFAAANALYERAAAGGSPDAMINLAVSLLEGEGTAPDPERGIALLRAAAEAGSARALFNLGVLAQRGALGEPAAAVDRFVRAAQGGFHPGWRAAAILLNEGRGVAPDPVRAAEMLLRGVAADDGTLLAEIEGAPAAWSPGTVRAAQERLRAAGLLEGAADGVPGPAFRAALAAWRGGGFDADVLGAI